MTPRLRASDAGGMRLEFARVEKYLALRLQSPVSRHADRREDTVTMVPRARKQGVAKSQTGSDTAILALEELRHWRKYCGCACACACERARCVRGPGSAPELLRMTPAPKSIHRSLPLLSRRHVCLVRVFTCASCSIFHSTSPPHSSFPCPPLLSFLLSPTRPFAPIAIENRTHSLPLRRRFGCANFVKEGTCFVIHFRPRPTQNKCEIVRAKWRRRRRRAALPP